jgi:hypothetical protein
MTYEELFEKINIINYDKNKSDNKDKVDKNVDVPLILQK